MKIEVGGTYELNDGKTHECTHMNGNNPLAINEFGYGPFVLDGMLYHQDGRFADCGADYILSVKRRIDTPQTWGKMTDAEKGALLLAYHEGKDIQCLQDGETPEYWGDIDRPNWSNDCKFRVRPEPVREVVELWHQSGDSVFDTHRITFETVDGKPDCATIKMEEM